MIIDFSQVSFFLTKLNIARRLLCFCVSHMRSCCHLNAMITNEWEKRRNRKRSRWIFSTTDTKKKLYFKLTIYRYIIIIIFIFIKRHLFPFSSSSLKVNFKRYYSSYIVVAGNLVLVVMAIILIGQNQSRTKYTKMNLWWNEMKWMNDLFPPFISRFLSFFLICPSVVENEKRK